MATSPEQVERITAAMQRKVDHFPGPMGLEEIVKMCVWDTVIMVDNPERIASYEAVDRDAGSEATP